MAQESAGGNSLELEVRLERGESRGHVGPVSHGGLPVCVGAESPETRVCADRDARGTKPDGGPEEVTNCRCA